MSITRKCSICKETVDLERDNVIYHNEKYSHFDCYVEYQCSKKRNKLTRDEIIRKSIDIQKEGFAIVKNIVIKEKLYKWLQSNYNVVVLPKFFFIKMDSIYDGTYKGLARGIPAEDLYDMWRRKKNELDKIADSNKRKGNEISGLGRLQYDLAIIINKYDSYLNWKEKQKILQQEQINSIEQQKTQKINMNTINKIVDNQEVREKSIGDLLDEVF
jgi:hypothetical protein